MEEQKESLREKEISSEQGFYLGVDLHKRKSWLAGMDQRGRCEFPKEKEKFQIALRYEITLTFVHQTFSGQVRFVIISP